jgi:hypothetical protein
MQAPNIDYTHWRNEYDSNIGGGVPSERTRKSLNAIRTKILNHIDQNDPLYAVLVNPALESRTMDKLEAEGKRLASMIDKETDLNKQDSFYLAIFDIVNAWGGGSIGRFYTSTNNPTSQTRRSAYKKFIPYYKKAVEKIKEGKYTEALSIIDSDKVPGIGISFGAKHVWFWSDFFKDSGSDKEVAPVYDMRIALAFRMWGGPKTSDYDSYLKELDGVKSKYKDFTRKDVERAVFAFSDHYFDNDMTSWNSGVEETDRNYNVAEDLFDERQKHISEPKVKELDIEANTIRSVGNLMKSPPEKLSDNQKDRIHKAFDILDSYSDKQLFTYSLKGGKETSSDLRSIIGMILGREDFEKEYEDFIKSEERNKKRKEVKKARADYNRSKVSEEYDTLLENIWNKWAKWATQ